jgi:hypothetical protein
MADGEAAVPPILHMEGPRPRGPLQTLTSWHWD